jgi:hypothetical protein
MRELKTRCGLLAIGVAAVCVLTTAAAQRPAADLIFHNAKVWTVDPARPTAQAVAVSAGRITAVGTSADILALKGPATRVVDVEGRLLLPGFIDAHTHFENACDWVFQVSLFDVNTQEELTRRLREAVARVPKGMWITGGDWGALAAWDRAKKGLPASESFTPSLKDVDAVAPDHPVLLRRHDMAYFANSLALARARFAPTSPDPRGGAMARDPQTGALIGMLFGRAGERLQQLMPPPSLERKVAGGRVALAELNRVGIVGIHDVARVDSISQRTAFHTAVERSASDLEIFLELRRRGQLTARVYPELTLATFRELKNVGITPHSGDDMIRYGALKAFVDGYLMFEPYADNPKYSGIYSFRYIDDQTMERDVIDADRAGFDPMFHVIGDRASNLLLNWFEKAIKTNPPRERRFRVIHGHFMTPADIERTGRLGLIVDVTPYHLIKDLGTIDRSVGPERAKTGHAWRSMMKAGARLNIVSDWPGSYNEMEYKPINPLENIYYAVTRQPLGGRPQGPWHPEECLTVEEAVRAYTINPAWSSYEDNAKGSVTVGKLADLVVLSKDILTVPPASIPTAEVLYTVLGGKVVYEKH